MLYKYQKRKLQSSLEFILVFSMLLSVLAIGATVSWIRIYGISEASKNLEISNLLDDIAGKINIAFLEGDGFSINVTVPQNILGKDYSITLYKNNVVIYFANATYSKSVLTENITGTIRKGINIVTNRDGEIVLI